MLPSWFPDSIEREKKGEDSQVIYRWQINGWMISKAYRPLKRWISQDSWVAMMQMSSLCPGEIVNKDLSSVGHTI